jgi:hypothetical protein
MSSVNAPTTFLLAGAKSADFGGNSAAYQSRQLGGRRTRIRNKNKKNKNKRSRKTRRRRG